MSVLGFETVDGPLLEALVGTDPVQHRRQDAQVGDLHREVLRNQRQAPGGQGDHLKDVVQVDVADTLQARLHDLLELVGVAGDAVDVLVIAHLLLAAGAVLAVFDDGQRYVRLQGQEPAVGVVEGDDPVADQKILVLDIILVGLEFAHLVGKIPVLPV